MDLVDMLSEIGTALGSCAMDAEWTPSSEGGIGVMGGGSEGSVVPPPPPFCASACATAASAAIWASLGPSPALHALSYAILATANGLCLLAAMRAAMRSRADMPAGNREGGAAVVSFNVDVVCSPTALG